MRNQPLASLASRKSRKQGLVGLLERARYEVLPTPSTEDKVRTNVPLGHTITVTASPAKGLEPTFALAETLQDAGYTAIPHIAARMVSGRAELTEICARLDAHGINGVFIPGGDAEAVGDYPDALALLVDLAEMGHPFAHVGIAGYPEPHPTIDDDLVIQDMWDKRSHASHIVSNLTFDPKAVELWVGRMRRRRVTTPLLLGLPGPVERTKLLSMATKIGVGESTRFLAKNKGLFARLAAPGGFTGERFLLDCAPTLTKPESLVEGLHVFTFNQIAETEAWRTELIERLSH